MPSLIRPAVIWLLAIVLPFQALTAAYLDVRGPAHVHIGKADDRPVHAAFHAHAGQQARSHEYGHVIDALGLYAQVPDRGRAHAHEHGAAERHHHHSGDITVVTVGDDRLGLLASREETTPGWSGSMLVALPADGVAPQLLNLAGGVVAGPERLLATRSPGRVERPPRTFST